MLKVICAWRSGFDTRQLTTTWASSRAGIPLAAAHEPATSRLPQGYRATTMRCVRAVRAGEPLLAPAETYGHEQRDAAGPGVLDARGLHRATRLGRWCWCRRGRLEHSRSRVRAKRATPDRDSAPFWELCGLCRDGGGRSGRCAASDLASNLALSWPSLDSPDWGDSWDASDADWPRATSARAEEPLASVARACSGSCSIARSSSFEAPPAKNCSDARDSAALPASPPRCLVSIPCVPSSFSSPCWSSLCPSGRP